MMGMVSAEEGAVCILNACRLQTLQRRSHGPIYRSMDAAEETELRSCVKVEVDVLDSSP